MVTHSAWKTLKPKRWSMLNPRRAWTNEWLMISVDGRASPLCHLSGRAGLWDENSCYINIYLKWVFLPSRLDFRFSLEEKGGGARAHFPNSYSVVWLHWHSSKVLYLRSVGCLADPSKYSAILRSGNWVRSDVLDSRVISQNQELYAVEILIKRTHVKRS